MHAHVVSTKSRFRRRSKVALAVIALSLAIAVFLPETVSAIWHVTHGRRAKFPSVSAPVPFGWWAFHGEDSLIIAKMPHSLLGEKQDQYVILQTSALPSSPQTDRDRRKASLSETQRKRGYAFVIENRSKIHGQDCYCYSFRNVNDERLVLTTCDIPGFQISIDFVGEAAQAPVFESILQGLRKTN